MVSSWLEYLSFYFMSIIYKVEEWKILNGLRNAIDDWGISFKAIKQKVNLTSQ